MPRSSGAGSVARRSSPIRNAASVLPDPVGAHRSVCAPEAIAGQPCSWAGVGPSGNASANQAAVAGEKRSGSVAAIPAVSLPSAVVIESLGDGLHRIRLPLPWSGLDHVWSYALEGPSGFTLFDAGLGTAEIMAVWRQVLPAAGRPGGAARHLPLPHRPHRREPRSRRPDRRRGGDVADRRDPGAALARPRLGGRDAPAPGAARLPGGRAGVGLLGLRDAGRRRASGGADRG